jgi:DNA-binding Lrp family transcriptional regulator
MAGPKERDVLALIESGVPLVPEPYLWLSERLGCTREQLLSVLTDLRGDGAVIRQISGIFDVAAFGYQQILAAFRVAPETVDRAGKIVGSHPGVSHAYRRDHSWNLWFTLAVSDQSDLGLEKTLDLLAGLAQTQDAMALPSLRKYKLRVRFASEAESSDSQISEPEKNLEIQDRHVRAVQALQKDLPNRMRPFDSLSRAQGLTTDALLEAGSELLDAGYMRRYAGVLHHRKAGASANVMTVWNAGDRDPDSIGQVLSSSLRVSHCYLRPTRDDWPYGLYAMVHGESRQQCLQSVEALATLTGIDDHLLLWTSKEYVKKRLELFSRAQTRWETDHLSP